MVRGRKAADGILCARLLDQAADKDMGSLNERRRRAAGTGTMG